MFEILRNRQGAALITVLLVATLASILAVSLATHQQVDIRRTANILDNDQAYILAQGVEAWGIQLLIRDGVGGGDSLDEDWAQGLFPTEVEGGIVSGYLEDAQGRFNINNLEPSGNYYNMALVQFRFLLEHCELDPDLAYAVADWLDADSTTGLYGAEDDYYLSLDSPYRAANMLMADPSELRLVKDIDSEAYVCLSQFVTAIPERRDIKINVNTASAVVLASLEATHNLEKVEAFVEKRPDNGFKDVDNQNGDFFMAARGNGLEFNNAKSFLSISSNYFIAHARSSIGRGIIHLESMIYQESPSNKIDVLYRRVNS